MDSNNDESIQSISLMILTFIIGLILNCFYIQTGAGLKLILF